MRPLIIAEELPLVLSKAAPQEENIDWGNDTSIKNSKRFQNFHYGQTMQAKQHPRQFETAKELYIKKRLVPHGDPRENAKRVKDLEANWYGAWKNKSSGFQEAMGAAAKKVAEDDKVAGRKPHQPKSPPSEEESLSKFKETMREKASGRRRQQAYNESDLDREERQHKEEFFKKENQQKEPTQKQKTGVESTVREMGEARHARTRAEGRKTAATLSKEEKELGPIPQRHTESGNPSGYHHEIHSLLQATRRAELARQEAEKHPPESKEHNRYMREHHSQLQHAHEMAFNANFNIADAKKRKIQKLREAIAHPDSTKEQIQEVSKERHPLEIPRYQLKKQHPESLATKLISGNSPKKLKELSAASKFHAGEAKKYHDKVREIHMASKPKITPAPQKTAATATPAPATAKKPAPFKMPATSSRPSPAPAKTGPAGGYRDWSTVWPKS